VGDLCFDPYVPSYRRDCLSKGALVTGDNLRTAMSNDRPRHALFRAPAELRANGRMPDESVATSADERALDRCAVANVDLDIF